MVKCFLITRPNYDVPTSYLHDFSQDIVKKSKSLKNLHVTDLEGPDSNRKNFEKLVVKEKPKLVFLNGHGSDSFVCGHKDEIILNSKNINLAKKSIVYALACNSLSKLGKISIKKGVKTYIGYKEDFMIARDIHRTSSPNKDKNAIPFKEACSMLIDNLVEGYPVNNCVTKTKDIYKSLIKYYGTSEDEYGDAPLIRFALTWDLINLDFCGDPNASF